MKEHALLLLSFPFINLLSSIRNVFPQNGRMQHLIGMAQNLSCRYRIYDYYYKKKKIEEKKEAEKGSSLLAREVITNILLLQQRYLYLYFSYIGLFLVLLLLYINNK